MKTVLVTSFDEHYMEYSKVFIKTLSENYNGKPIDLFCLVPSNILDNEKSFVESLGGTGNITVIFKCSHKFELLSNRLVGRGYISSNAWHRMFLGSVCSDYDRAIYIDSDTIVLRDIEPIINYMPGSKVSAYVQDDPELSLQLYGTPDMPYFNAGVMIIDLKYWNDSAIEDVTINSIENNSIGKYLDQDALNKHFGKEFTPMPVTFNCPHWYQEGAITMVDSPIIVHFIGSNKPWKSYESKSIVPSIWRKKHLEITGIDLSKTEEFYERLAIHE